MLSRIPFSSPGRFKEYLGHEVDDDFAHDQLLLVHLAAEARLQVGLQQRYVAAQAEGKGREEGQEGQKKMVKTAYATCGERTLHSLLPQAQ